MKINHLTQTHILFYAFWPVLPNELIIGMSQGSAMGWDETVIPFPGCKIPGWDRDRDEFSVISGIRDGTGISFGKPGWDRDAPLNPGIPPAIPDLFEEVKLEYLFSATMFYATLKT